MTGMRVGETGWGERLRRILGRTSGVSPDRPTAPAGPDADAHHRWALDLADGRRPALPVDRESFDSWRRATRLRLEAALGLDRIASDLAGFVPRFESRGSDRLGDVIRDEWRMHVEPGISLPFHVLYLESVKGPAPLVLTPHGHGPPYLYVAKYESPQEEAYARSGHRDVAVQAAREGYIALAPVLRGFGETRTSEDIRKGALCSCRAQLVHGLLSGRTPIGERVWDILRLIDWALANLPVDSTRIGITGNSAGGTTSLYAAACDDRIGVVVPSCCFASSAASIGSMWHCECNYVPGLIDMGDLAGIAGLLAPRPLRILAGRDDKLFPVASAQSEFERVRQCYRAAGAGERCDLYVGEGGHQYYREASWPFFAAVWR